MLDALADELDVSDQHRAGGVKPLFMGHAHHPKPIVPAALSDADAATDARGENLAPTAGDRVEPRLVEPADDFPHIHSKKSLELHKLRRRKRVDVYRREV